MSSRPATARPPRPPSRRCSRTPPSIAGRDGTALRQLAMAGCGELIVGRRGAPTRFRSIAGMNRLGDLMARGAPASAAVARGPRAGASRAGAAPAPERPWPPTKPPEPDETRPALVTHRFQLRPDLVIQLHLPRDLTTREAERLGMFIDSLPFA